MADKGRKLATSILIAVFLLSATGLSAFAGDVLKAQYLRTPAARSIGEDFGRDALQRLFSASQDGKEIDLARLREYVTAWIQQHGLEYTDPELEYLVDTYAKFSQEIPLLIIGEAAQDGDRKVIEFIPTARMTRAEREEEMTAVGHSDLMQNADEYIAAAGDVFLMCNPLDGGTGKNFIRKKYLNKRREEAESEEPEFEDPAILTRARNDDGNIIYGAKGVDIVYKVTYIDKTGKITNRKLSIAEIKVLRLITEIDKGIYSRGNVRYQPLISRDSKQSYLDLMELECLLYPGKTYGEVLRERGVIPLAAKEFDQSMEEFNTKLLPVVDKDTLQLVADKKAPGGHGQLGMIFLMSALDPEVQKEVEGNGRTHIRVFYNGDNASAMADPVTIGYMKKNKVPIAMLTTTKAGIDRKGGQLGMAIYPDGKKRKQILELKQAQNVDKDMPGYSEKHGKSHEETFYHVGLPDAENEPEGAYNQDFNTNIALINYSVLVPLFQTLIERRIATREDLIKAMTPDLIKNEKGDSYCIDSALASALLNLDTFFEWNREAQDVLFELTGSRSLVHQIRIGLDERSQFFASVKMGYDLWLQGCTDYYTIDTENWIFRDNAESLQKEKGPPVIELNSGMTPEGRPKGEGDKDYYDEAQNLEDHLGTDVKARGLRGLRVQGLVMMPNCELKGYVAVMNHSGRAVNLYSEEIKQKLLRNRMASLSEDGRLIINNRTIEIWPDGRITESRPLRETSIYRVKKNGEGRKFLDRDMAMLDEDISGYKGGMPENTGKLKLIDIPAKYQALNQLLQGHLVMAEGETKEAVLEELDKKAESKEALIWALVNGLNLREQEVQSYRILDKADLTPEQAQKLNNFRIGNVQFIVVDTQGKALSAEEVIRSLNIDPDKARFILTSDSNIQTGNYIVERFQRQQLQRLIMSIAEVLPAPEAIGELEQLRDVTKALSFV